MKFKAQEFLRDIGLDMHIELLERTVAETSNIYQLPLANLSAEVAVMRVVDNLTATYGTQAIKDILAKYTNE